jgi:hypothetical protein
MARPSRSGNSLKPAGELGQGVRPSAATPIPVAAVAVAVALLLLAGCAQPGPAAPAAAPAEATHAAHAPRTLDVRQSGCESVTWSVPVTAASLKPYLPEGFEPSPPQDQGSLDAAAALGFRAVECTRGLGQDVDLAAVQSGAVFTRVVPPAGLREDRFGARYLFGWDVLAAPEAWRASAAGWGLPVHDGGSFVGPGAQGWTGSLAMDQVGSFSITGRSLTASASPDDQESRLVTLGAQGFALWDTETANATASDGVGVWEVSPESWVAQVLGSTQGVAAFEYMTFDVPSGAVHWPGQGLSPVDDSGSHEVEPPSLPARPPVTLK